MRVGGPGAADWTSEEADTRVTRQGGILTLLIFLIFLNNLQPAAIMGTVETARL